MRIEADSRRSEHMAALRSALWRMRRATRAQLARETGLSVMTVGKLIAVMEARGEIAQGETERAGAGRPSTVARYNGDYAHFASIVVEQLGGKSAFTLSVLNLFGETVLREEMLLEAVSAQSFDGFFERVLAAGYRLALAVFVLPGVAREDEIILCDLEPLREGQVLRHVKRRFGVEVLFENDVNGAVLGHAFEKSEGVCAGVYFPKNYCPGAGVVIDGEILYGTGHFTGEIGYIDGEEVWMQLDYGDERAVTERISRLLVIYACVTAPARMVLYGDFFTSQMEAAIRARFEAQMLGRFSMALSFRKTMTQDMERGAARLGLGQMFALLHQNDRDKGE